MALTFRCYDCAMRTRNLPFLPLLLIQFFWANWHSSCPLGVFAGIVFAATELFMSRLRASRKSPTVPIPAGQLLLLPFALAAVSLLNPNGWVPLVYGLIESRRWYVLEFQPPNWQTIIGALGLAFLTALLGYRTLFRANRIFWPIIVGAFMIQSTRMNRFIPYLLISLAPLMAAGITKTWNLVRARGLLLRAPAIMGGTAIAALAAVASFSQYEDKPLWTFGADESRFPAGAVDFVLRENLTGRLYNEFNAGGYVTWRLAPDRKVFVYGETSINGPVLDRIYACAEIPDYRKMFDDYDANIAILSCAQGKLIRQNGITLPRIILEYWKDWKLVFWDDTGMVFVKDLPQYHDLIARRTCLVNPESIPFKNNPVVNIVAMGKLGRDAEKWPKAEAELQRAITDSTRHFRAALALGIGRLASGSNPTGAMEAFRIAESLHPDNPELLQYMAEWSEREGKFDDAISYLNRAIAADPNSAESYYALAKAQFETGKPDLALKSLDHALEINPNHGPAARARQSILTKHPASK